MSSIPAIVSIHDVMPSTLANVENFLTGLLASLPKSNVSLLVVPGLAWSSDQIETLKRLQSEGYEIVGHGWCHESGRVQRLYHRLHSFFVSRQSAEHLALTETQIVDLLWRNFKWFTEHDFNPPQLYVPPAWAMGRVRQQALHGVPFSFFESSRGFNSTASRYFRCLPLVGFEADTAVRAFFLRYWNKLNIRFAKAFGAVRVSIHPYDHTLLLADQLSVLVPQLSSLNWRLVVDNSQS